MPTYALLVLPGFNRVYGRDAPKLLRAELAVVSAAVLDDRLHDVREQRIGGVPYVVFDAPPLAPDALAYLANLSSAYALFETEGDALRPVELRRLERLDDDLLTIQRYSGKTNEQFTKLLLNVTLLASARGRRYPHERVRVLDPVAGRGTTLNQALVYGFDASGVEVERAAFDAYASFLTQWLRDKRLKHVVRREPVRRGGRIAATRLDVELAPSKEAMKAGDVQRVRFVHDDTRNVLDHFRPASFDAVVADLPYGVQHATRGPAGASRSPEGLVADALATWAKLLRRGGGIGLAFNARALPRDTLLGHVEAAGLRPSTLSGLGDLAHAVDRSVRRDVVVAERP